MKSAAAFRMIALAVTLAVVFASAFPFLAGAPSEFMRGDRLPYDALQATEIWQAMLREMPQGLPEAGDRGLDYTDTWGRKYWGGAMFCLLADIEIRKATGNKLGLRDAMRGVIAAGGNHEQDWPIA